MDPELYQGVTPLVSERFIFRFSGAGICLILFSSFLLESMTYIVHLGCFIKEGLLQNGKKIAHGMFLAMAGEEQKIN